MKEAAGPLRAAYSVFICYSHADNKEHGRQWATWLRHSLESYEVPPELVGKLNSRGETVPASLFPVFRDEEELPADANLSTKIQQALERSRLMVVICSPRAVASSYVDQEIRHFKQIGSSDRILPLIVDGEPNASSNNCFPSSLTETEPLAADIRPEGKPVQGWTSAAAYRRELKQSNASRAGTHALTDEYQKRLELAKLKVIAGVLGLPLGELTHRDRAFQLAKARKQARAMRTWLAVVSALSVAVAVSGFLAFRGQREAIRQRDRALTELYVLGVRQAAAKIADGDFAAAREILLKAPRSKRAWEWWYLVERCGPSPRSLSEIEKIASSEAASMKSDLDAIAAMSRDGRPYRSSLSRNGGIRSDSVFEYEAYGGRGGSVWRARRVGENGAILLNGFATGMYGSIDAAKIGADASVAWRIGKDDATSRKPPQLASGEKLPKNETDYLTFLRERYVIGPLGSALPPDNFSGEVATPEDRRTWIDAVVPAENASRITPDSTGEEVLFLPVYGFIDGRSLNLKTGVISIVPSPARRWQNLVSLTPPDERALAMTVADRQGLPADDMLHYHIAVERGSKRPLILSTWGFGSVRLRNATTGTLLGESISPVREHGLPFYGGAAAIVPGTDLVAGWFWWRGKVIAGVIDLQQSRLLVRFDEAPDMDEELATTPYSSMTISPNGEEAAFQFSDRNDRYFAVWSVKTGRMIYGPAGSLYERTRQKGDKIPIPSGFSWHPDGDFVVVRMPNGVTELRRSFATAPFARIEDDTGDVRVEPIGEKARVLIGNAVVDTDTWQTIVTLPSEHYVSRDGDLAVLQTRPGVVEVVRLSVRNHGRDQLNLRDLLLLHEISESDSRLQN